ncbi:MAG: hypothetical protein ABSD98_10230 [Candidatus Korobacteraceae bacterium]
MPKNIDFEAVLRQCSTEDAYREACKIATHGREFDPDSLEPLWQELRTDARRYLQPSDLDKIFEQGKTVYGYYWRVPKENWDGPGISLHESQCAKPGWKESIVQKLFARLSRMEVVSVLLSCVYPGGFGVYSPPIMAMLQIPPCAPIQHYLKYCEELQEWGRRFLESENVCTADRAVWVFYQLAYSPASNLKTQLIYRKAHDEDYWIRQRHAKNTLTSYFSDYPPLKQARFLLEIDLYLAGAIAGCEFEARIRDLVPEARRRRLDEDLWSIIEYLAVHCGYAQKKARFHEIRELRNMAIHRSPGLTTQKVTMMIKETDLIPKRGIRQE